MGDTVASIFWYYATSSTKVTKPPKGVRNHAKVKTIPTDLSMPTICLNVCLHLGYLPSQCVWPKVVFVNVVELHAIVKFAKSHIYRRWITLGCSPLSKCYTKWPMNSENCKNASFWEHCINDFDYRLIKRTSSSHSHWTFIFLLISMMLDYNGGRKCNYPWSRWMLAKGN